MTDVELMAAAKVLMMALGVNQDDLGTIFNVLRDVQRRSGGRRRVSVNRNGMPERRGLTPHPELSPVEEELRQGNRVARLAGEGAVGARRQGW